MRYSFPRRSLELTILLEPKPLRLHKSRSKNAPKLAHFGLTARWRPPALERGPASGPAALYLLYTQGIGFWELVTLESWFRQKRTFASSIRGLPDSKIRQLLDPVRSGFHKNS